MHRRSICLARAAALALIATTAATALAVRPEIERDSYTARFHDDFILDACGIDTWTTVTERWTLKTYPDGSQTFQASRTFVSDDPRIPVEKGAGTGFFGADGSQTVVGKPIQLFKPDGGVLLLDAGRVEFDPDGNVSTVRGPHPSLNVDLADYYCP